MSSFAMEPQDDYKKVRLEKIIPNPERNLEAYGYSDLKIETLTKSIKTDGFKFVPFVRPCATRPGYYELAFGHHRIESARRLFGDGYTISVIVLSASDEQMRSLMAKENDAVYTLQPSFVLSVIEMWEKKDPGITQAEIADELNLPIANIADFQHIRNDISSGRFSAQVIKVLPNCSSARKFYRYLSTRAKEGIFFTLEQQESVADKMLREPEAATANIPLYFEAIIVKNRRQSVVYTEEQQRRTIRRAMKSIGQFRKNLESIVAERWAPSRPEILNLMSQNEVAEDLIKTLLNRRDNEEA